MTAGWQGGGRSAGQTFGPDGGDPGPGWGGYIETALAKTPAAPPLWSDIEQPRLTYRTLADISDDPPGELLLGMFEPGGPTLAMPRPAWAKA